MVQDALQAFVLVAVLDIEHIRHNRRFGDDLEQHDTGFLIEDSAAVRPPEGSQRVRDQFLIVGRRHGERDQFGKVVLFFELCK